jgi:hypothetical protein
MNSMPRSTESMQRPCRESDRHFRETALRNLDPHSQRTWDLFARRRWACSRSASGCSTSPPTCCSRPRACLHCGASANCDHILGHAPIFSPSRAWRMQVAGPTRSQVWLRQLASGNEPLFVFGQIEQAPFGPVSANAKAGKRAPRY